MKRLHDVRRAGRARRGRPARVLGVGALLCCAAAAALPCLSAAQAADPPALPPVEFGAMFMNDWAFFDYDEPDAAEPASQDDESPFADGTEFRAARLGCGALLGPHLELKLEYDFGGGEATAADVYLQLSDVPFLNLVRVGHQFEPMNRLSGSSRNLVFLEKGLPNAFTSGRNTGIRTITPLLGQRMTLSLGAFRATDDTGANLENEETHLGVRWTGLPLYRERGRQLVHAGVYVHRWNLGDEGVRFRQRPESHLAPYLVDTGDIAASTADFLGFEAAAIAGPVFLEADYIRAGVDARETDDLDFDGTSVAVGWTLTGEPRPYSRLNGNFTRFVPARPFDPAAGAWGALMFVARWSWLDLNDGPVRGGTMRDVSFGFDWYLTAQTRFLWNYILVDAQDRGDLRIMQMRVQVDL